VFIKENNVSRHLTEKEACQLLDIPGIWSKNLKQNIWGWNNGSVVPLRLFVETLLKVSPWRARGKYLVIPIEDDSTRLRNDFSRMLVQTKTAEMLGESGLFRLSYFRWVWEPQTENEISTATKSDDAGVNKSLWAVGGDAPGMEESREKLRRCLFRVWYLRLWQEANGSLSWRKLMKDAGTISENEYKRDKIAIQDCLQRSRGSNWWEWADGSQLYYWQWPECWRSEARDGARAYHPSVPPRKPVAQKVKADSPEQQHMIEAKVKKLIE
jgi:hypothetical protein